MWGWWLQALLTTNINYATGAPGGGQITMGALADSYYEYLLKACIRSQMRALAGIF